MFYIIQIVLSLKGMECRVSPSEQIVKHFDDKDSNKNKTKQQQKNNISGKTINNK